MSNKIRVKGKHPKRIREEKRRKVKAVHKKLVKGGYVGEPAEVFDQVGKALDNIKAH